MRGAEKYAIAAAQSASSRRSARVNGSFLNWLLSSAIYVKYRAGNSTTTATLGGSCPLSICYI
jgi:hypothetical protein